MAEAGDMKTVGTRPTCQATSQSEASSTCQASSNTEFSGLEVGTPSSASSNNRLGQNTLAMEANEHPTGDRAKAAQARHETGLMVQAEQQFAAQSSGDAPREECE